MERYSLEQAENESEELKKKAQDFRHKRLKGTLYEMSLGEPDSEDYKKADHYFPHAGDERIISPELEKEVMGKVVDIFSEKDLKLRNDDLISTEFILKRGVISPFNRDFFVKDNEDENITTLQKQRRIRKKEKTLLEDSEIYQEDKEYKEYSHKANVYYPEGILKTAHSIIKNNFEINPKEHKKVFQRDIPDMLRTFCHVIDVFSSRGILNLNKEKAILLKNILIKNGLIKPSLIEKEETDIDEKELNELKKELIDNFEEIRKEWVRHFYEVAGTGRIGRYQSHFVPYKFTSGVLFDSSLDVSISFNSDYPTQATIRDLNNKKHIIGLIVKEGIIQNRIHGNYFGLLRGLAKNAPKEEVEKIKRENPNFIRILESDRIQTFATRGFIEDEEFSLTDEEKACLEKCKEIVNQYSIVKPHMRLYDIFRQLGEKYKLPVYDLKGNLLWPVEKSNEEVKEFLKERNMDEEK